MIFKSESKEDVIFGPHFGRKWGREGPRPQGPSPGSATGNSRQSNINQFIFKLLFLPVRSIGRDFPFPHWFPCLLSSLFHPKNTWHMTSYADSAAFFLNYSLYYKYSLVLCYLLASFSENIDGDWLPRISASFLLIKEKEKNEGVYFNRISETFL